MSSETIINDSMLLAYANQISCCEELDSIFKEYISTISQLKDKAIKSGGVHDVLEKIYELVSTIYDKNNGLGTQAANEIESFIKNIETIDLELYRG